MLILNFQNLYRIM